MLPDGKGDDIYFIWPPSPPPKQDWHNVGDHDEMIDCWGNVDRRATGGVLGFGEIAIPVVSDITKQAELEFPDFNNPAYVAGNRDKIVANNASGNPKYVLGKMPVGSLFAGVHGVMGLDQLFLAIYEAPDHLKALIGRFAAAQRESIRLMHEIGCDGVMAYDDWAVQDRLMMSVEHFKEFFLPHYRENWTLAHKLGMDVWMHSCGYIVELLPFFIDAGLNVVQMDQQENMGLERLSREFGGKVAFWCPVDIQRTMITGTQNDVRAYVKRMVETLGAHNGGLVSKFYPTPDAVHHDPRNTAAMCEAFREYGVYKKV